MGDMNRQMRHYARQIVADYLPGTVIRSDENCVYAGRCTKTDEGHDIRTVTVFSDDHGLHVTMSTDAIDCDGRTTSVEEYIVERRKSARHGKRRWALRERERVVRDYAAEAMNY